MTITVAIRPDKPKHPYPGLRPFEPDEWPIFFGRDRLVDDLIDRLVRDRMLFIHGASGSGKSSLVRAGVLPRLARQQRRQGGTWRGCLMRPSGGPLWNLARAFAGLEGRENDLDRIEELVRLCNARDATLSSVAGALDGMVGEPLCILVDQFEELFRFAKETCREEAEVFVDLLTREIGEAREGSALAHVVVTIRSEFLGDCARFDGLAEAINRTQYLVPRMEREGLDRAITRPAKLFNGDVAPELAERLIAEGRGQDDELPLIQHALMLIWNEAEARTWGQTIKLDAWLLDGAGNLAELLSGHANRVLAEAARTEERQRVAENLFRALTDINADGQAIRRPQKFGDLVAVCGGFEDDARSILDAFRAEGVSFLTPYAPEPIEAKTVIDIGHEAVIRCWSKIAEPREGWLAKEFHDGRAWASLLVQAKRFGTTKSDLLSPASTEETQEWLLGRNDIWAERYGGEWGSVGLLLDASAKARDEARLAEEHARKVMEKASELTQSVLSSPLTRRIVVLNLGGLVALLGGFLYLNQFREGLIEARVTSLQTQGEIIAAAVAASATVDTDAITIDPEKLLKLAPGESYNVTDGSQPALEFSLNPKRFGPLLRRLVTPTGTRARIYDRDGELLLDSRSVSGRSNILRFDLPPGVASRAQFGEDARTPYEEFVNALRRWSRPGLPLYEDIGTANGKGYPEVADALAGNASRMVRANAKGETIISVAVPVQRFRSVRGALLLSTLGGDIDGVIATERWAIIRAFLVAAGLMLLLSLLTASSLIHQITEIIERAHPGFRGDGATKTLTSAFRSAFPRFIALWTKWNNTK